MSGIHFAILFVCTTIVVDLSRVYQHQPNAIELLDYTFKHIELPHHVRYAIKAHATNHPAITSMAMSLILVLAVHIGGWLCSILFYSIARILTCTFSWVFALVQRSRNILSYAVHCSWNLLSFIVLKLRSNNSLIETIIATNQQILEILERHDSEIKSGCVATEQQCNKMQTTLSLMKRDLLDIINKQTSALSGHKKAVISFAGKITDEILATQDELTNLSADVSLLPKLVQNIENASRSVRTILHETRKRLSSSSDSDSEATDTKPLPLSKGGARRQLSMFRTVQHLHSNTSNLLSLLTLRHNTIIGGAGSEDDLSTSDDERSSPRQLRNGKARPATPAAGRKQSRSESNQDTIVKQPQASAKSKDAIHIRIQGATPTKPKGPRRSLGDEFGQNAVPSDSDFDLLIGSDADVDGDDLNFANMSPEDILNQIKDHMVATTANMAEASSEHRAQHMNLIKLLNKYHNVNEISNATAAAAAAAAAKSSKNKQSAFAADAAATAVDDENLAKMQNQLNKKKRKSRTRSHPSPVRSTTGLSRAGPSSSSGSSSSESDNNGKWPGHQPGSSGSGLPPTGPPIGPNNLMSAAYPMPLLMQNPQELTPTHVKAPDLKRYLRSFSERCDLLNMNDQHKRSYLLTSSGGTYKQFLQDAVDHNKNVSWRKLCHSMLDFFTVKRTPEEKMVYATTYFQEPNQNFRNYMLEIRRRLLDADKTMSEHRIVDYAIVNSNDDVRIALMSAKPRKWNDLLNMCKDIEKAENNRRSHTAKSNANNQGRFKKSRNHVMAVSIADDAEPAAAVAAAPKAAKKGKNSDFIHVNLVKQLVADAVNQAFTNSSAPSKAAARKDQEIRGDKPQLQQQQQQQQQQQPNSGYQKKPYGQNFNNGQQTGQGFQDLPKTPGTVCHYCNIKNHTKPQCQKKKRDEAKGYWAQTNYSTPKTYQNDKQTSSRFNTEPHNMINTIHKQQQQYAQPQQQQQQQQSSATYTLPPNQHFTSMAEALNNYTGIPQNVQYAQQQQQQNLNSRGKQN